MRRRNGVISLVLAPLGSSMTGAEVQAAAALQKMVRSLARKRASGIASIVLETL
jgi:hypothetical protein